MFHPTITAFSLEPLFLFITIHSMIDGAPETPYAPDHADVTPLQATESAHENSLNYQVNAMLCIKSIVALLAIVLLASSCATVGYSYAERNEPINWREYNDC